MLNLLTKITTLILNILFCESSETIHFIKARQEKILLFLKSIIASVWPVLVVTGWKYWLYVQVEDQNSRN